MQSLSKFSNDSGNAHPAPMALFRPEHQGAVLEIISSTGRGEMSTAARIWSRLFPSKADRAITANETALIEARGKTQRQMVILMGEALHKDAKARLAAQHHMAVMTLNRERMAWYVKESKEVHEMYMNNILEFCKKFMDFIEEVNDYPEMLKQEASKGMENCLYGKLMTLNAFLQNFEQDARQKLQ